MTLLFLLDLFEIVEIKGEGLVSFIHFGSILFTPLIVLFDLLIFQFRKLAYLLYVVPIVLTICFSTVIVHIGLLHYLFSVGSFETQAILYENTYNSFKTIEFQMEDIGALGYNERYVEVTYFTPWFMITKEIDPEEDPGPGWIKVDKEVNELEIKY